MRMTHLKSQKNASLCQSVCRSVCLSVTHGFQSFFYRGVDVINITVEFLIYDSLNCDATAAALRDCMAKTKNTLVTLADEYKATLASLKVGSSVS